ncbi:MAG: FAD-dependent oxidoreductase [Prochloron sp. SP5CPC1]|nr:FAD-dependent oxidoreductase [Candidatus Paraprochloron terpiosi SP5CPC1]
MINFTRPTANSQQYQSLNVITELEECRRANHQRGKRITILGAGIAGLVAAYELERLGHQVDIMEGSPRIGGRIWTHRFGDGPGAPYGELGAMRIPRDHDYVLHYVHAMGLGDKLCKFVTMFEEANALFHYQGSVFPIQDGVEGILHQTTYPRRYSKNTRLFAAWLQLIVNAIASEELRQCLTQDLNSHLMDELEMLDLEPFIMAGGKGIDLDGFIKEHPDFRKQCSKALDLFLGDILMETSHDLLQLEGGMDQLTNRLATAVKGPIKCNQEVVAIRVLENGIEVSWLEKGRLRKRYCDYVLCTIRHIKVTGTNSPCDLELEEYWQKRQTKAGKEHWAKGSKYESVAIAQNWRCQICHEHLFNGEEIETHHIAQGGSNDQGNLMHLHKPCHRQVHSKKKTKRVGLERTQSG